MGLFGLRRNPLKDQDADVRLAAVHQLADDRQTDFERLAIEDPDARIRATCAQKVRRSDALQRLMERGDEAVKRIARERLSTVAGAIAKEHGTKAGANLLDAVEDRGALADLAVHAKDPAMRERSFAKLQSLTEVPEPLWEAVAVQDAEGRLGVQAVPRIAARSVLKRVAKKAKSRAVRDAATAAMARMEQAQEQVSADARRAARAQALDQAVARATRLSVTAQGAGDSAAWTAVDAQVAAALALADGLPVDEPAQRHLDRIATAKDAAAKLVAQARAADAAAVEARTAHLAALAAMEASAPGNNAARERELRTRWLALGGSADDPAFTAQVQRLCPAPGAAPEPVVPAGLPELNAEAEQAAGMPDRKAAAIVFQGLHKRWMMLASDLPAGHPERERFNRAYAAFKAARAAAGQERAERRSARREERQALIAECKALTERGSTIAPDDDIQAYGREVETMLGRWRALGPATPAERDLRDAWQTAIDAAHAPLRARREAADWERFANRTKAEELIAQAEALAQEADLSKVVPAVQRLHAAWKQLGPQPRDTAQTDWQRFHGACQREYDRAKPWIEEQAQAREQSAAQRRELIAEVERLAAAGPVGLAGSPADRNARRAAADRVKEMQAQWKACGPAPRQDEDALWSAWRTVNDAFWGKHREFAAADAASREENLKACLALIASAERLADDSERSKANGSGLLTPQDVMRRVRELQAQWKQGGQIPKDQVEPCWQRFKAACDRAYASIKDHLDAQEAEREANLQARLAVIAELEDILKAENPRWHVDDVTRLKERWRAIGRVAREHADATERRFDEALGKFKRLA